MIGMVLVTHGLLATEFKAALEHVVGPQDQIETITIGPEDDMELRRRDIMSAVCRVNTGDGVVVLTDMFGGTPSNLAMTFLGQDNVEVMEKLGFKRFGVAGHDRGARTAFRLCLDHPERVERMCSLDIVPTHHLLTNLTVGWGQESYHWFFLAQPHDKPERMILRDVEDWFDSHTTREPKGKSFFHPDARVDWLVSGKHREVLDLVTVVDQRIVVNDRRSGGMG